MPVITIGLDIGNTNTSAAFSIDNGKPKLIKLGSNGQESLPSIVSFPVHGGAAIVGPEALMSDGILLTNFKEQLFRDRSDRSSGVPDALSAMAAILSEISSCIDRYAENYNLQQALLAAKSGVNSVHFVIGVPAQVRDDYKDNIRRALVMSKWFSSYKETEEIVTFMPEPCAPFNLLSLDILRDGSRVMVIDYGGLTLDIVVGMASKVVHDGSHVKISDSDDRSRITTHDHQNVGGSYYDHLLLKSICDMAGGLDKFDNIIRRTYGIDSDVMDTMVDFGIDKLRSTENLNSDYGNEARRVYQLLCRDMEYLRFEVSDKTMANRYDKVDLWLGRWVKDGHWATPHKVPLEITIGDMIKAFDPVSELVADKVKELYDRHKPSPVIVVGGVANTKWIWERLNNATHAECKQFSDYNLMHVVALGLGKRTHGGIVSEDAFNKTDMDYGVYLERTKEWDVILPANSGPSDYSVSQDEIRNGTDKGIYRQYRPISSELDVEIRVGCRRPGETKWEELGKRQVTIPTANEPFRIYFSISEHAQVLQATLYAHRQQRFIDMQNPNFMVN